MKVDQICGDLFRIQLLQPDLVNAYLAEDVLIDSGGRLARRKLLAFLDGRKLSGHALTHGHFDHQGCSHAVCERFGIPLFCGEGDRAAVESGDLVSLMPHPGALIAWLTRSLAGPAHPVSRTLVEGDEIGGLRVIETPGHTPGHLAFWQEDGRVLILGDVLFHRNPVTFRKGLAEPFQSATYNRESNLDSARKLAALEPRVVCFGHGSPLTDGEEFCRYVESLPHCP